jgi:hypothetical protein
LVLSGILFLLGVRNSPSLNLKRTFWAFIEARVLQVWRTNDACLMMLIVMMIDQLAVHVMNTNLNKHYVYFWWIFCTESSHHNLNVCCLGFQSGHYLCSHVLTHFLSCKCTNTSDKEKSFTGRKLLNSCYMLLFEVCICKMYLGVVDEIFVSMQMWHTYRIQQCLNITARTRFPWIAESMC